MRRRSRTDPQCRELLTLRSSYRAPIVRQRLDLERVPLRERPNRELHAVGGIADEGLLASLRAYPDVPTPSVTAPVLPIVPVSFAKDGRRFDFFSTVTTLGTPQDVTVQETRIECFFPADEATERAARALT